MSLVVYIYGSVVSHLIFSIYNLLYMHRVENLTGGRGGIAHNRNLGGGGGGEGGTIYIYMKTLMRGGGKSLRGQMPPLPLKT